MSASHYESQMTEAALQVKKAKEGQQRKLYEDSKLRLLQIIEQKMNTSFIGALAKFEKYFGWLWGHGKLYQELSDQERRFRSAWRQARMEVLDNGNDQMRAISQEADRYTMRWNGFQVQLTNQNGEQK